MSHDFPMDIVAHANHTLSELSRKLNRNVFLWKAPSTMFQGGIRVDEQQPVTVATLYRWIDNLALRGPYHGERPAAYELRSVNITDTNLKIFDYLIDLNTVGSVLSRSDSTTVVLPGDYGIFHPSYCPTNPVPCRLALPYITREPFAQEEADVRSAVEADWPSQYALGEHLSEEARSRDQRCIITGKQVQERDLLKTVWICPPTILDPRWSILCRLIRGVDQRWIPDMTLYTSVQNVVTLCNDVAHFFVNNQVGVDVDDNYRIRFFGSLEDRVKLNLPERLDLAFYGESGNLPSDEALREHFEHCLYLYMLRGDISEQYAHFSLSDWLEDQETPNDISHSEWDSELGREVKRLLLECAFESSSTALGEEE